MSMSQNRPLPRKQAPLNGSFVFYYFPSGPWNPFGHVAVGQFKINNLTYHDNKNAPSGYLSYYSGSGLVRDALRYFITEFGIYNNKAFELTVPPCAAEKLKKAIAIFGGLDFGDYTLRNQTCATAVLDFLQNTNTLNPKEKFQFPRPQYIARRVCELVLKKIQTDRYHILQSNLPPLEKIQKLIANDIDRLETNYDEIINNPMKNKKEKIDLLKSLLEKVSEIRLGAEIAYEQIGYKKLLVDFIDYKSKLKDETARNLQECIEALPIEQIQNLHHELIKAARNSLDKGETDLPKERERAISEFSINFAASQRLSIIGDAKMEGMEKIKQLIASDVKRFKAELSNKTTKSPKDLQSELNNLYTMENLLKLFSTTPPDYEKCLAELQKTIAQLKGNTATELSICLEYFPYDKTPKIDSAPLKRLAAKGKVEYEKIRKDQIEKEIKLITDLLKSGDCNNPIREIKKLILLNIERLKIKSNLDKTSTFGMFKNTAVKTNKSQSLEVLNKLFTQDPLDLEACLNTLISAANSDTMKKSSIIDPNKTGELLRLLVDRFPYESLPNIEAKKTYLIKLINIMPDVEKFPEVPAFKKLKDLLVDEPYLDNKSSKDIYHLFSDCKKILEAREGNILGSDEKNKATFNVLLWHWLNEANAVGTNIDAKQESITSKTVRQSFDSEEEEEKEYDTPSTSSISEEEETHDSSSDQEDETVKKFSNNTRNSL